MSAMDTTFAGMTGLSYSFLHIWLLPLSLRFSRLRDVRPKHVIWHDLIFTRYALNIPGSGLGRVDGFHQDKGAGERDKGGEVLCRLLAAQGDAFEALDLADALFGAGASFVEYLGEERRFGGGILAVRDGGADAAPARRLSVRLGVVAFVAEHRPRGDVRANVEQDLEVAAVAGLAGGQGEGQRQAIEIELH